MYILYTVHDKIVQVIHMKANILKLVIPYLIAILAFAYLVYTLGLKGVALDYMHFWVFLLVVFLVLAPLAERLKLFNVIDFNSKIEALRQETTRELSEIRNQISSNVSSHVTPIQNQWTLVGVDAEIAGQLIQKFRENPRNAAIPTKDSEGECPSRIEFIRRVERCVYRSYDALAIAHAMQITYIEKRMIEPRDLVDGDVEDKVDHHLNNLLRDGLRPFVPDQEIFNTTNQLMNLKKLIDLYRMIKLGKDDPSDQEEWEDIISSAHEGITGISIGIAIQSSQLIQASISLRDYITSKKKELGLDEQAPDRKT